MKMTPDNLPPILRTAVTYQELVAGQVLFYQRDPVWAIFALEIGRLRLVRYTNEGKLVVFGVPRAGESFGQAALFSDVYNCDAIAEVPSRVIVYPKQPLLQVLRDQPELSFDLMEQLSHMNQSLKIRLKLLSLRTARERVLKYLLVAAQPGETTVNLDRSLKDIAGELGLSPETLSRTLTQLEREGSIARALPQITLCNTSTTRSKSFEDCVTQPMLSNILKQQPTL